jgi:predicted permease
MDQILAELRLAVRSLVRSPTFSVAASAILALGIGASTAMFQIYKTVLVERLPLVAQDRLVVMHPLDRRGTHLDAPGTYLATVARDSLLFRGAAGNLHRGAVPLPFLDRNTPIQLAVVLASANYFDVLGMRPYLGRLFRTDDGSAGAAPVIVLSFAAWSRRFGRDSSIIGHTLVLPYTEQRARIVGVTPPGFQYPAGADVWLPMTPKDAESQVDIIARLAPNVSIDAARAGFFALTQRLNPFASLFAKGEGKGQSFEIAGVDVRPLAETVLGNSRPTLVALTLAVGVLLLIACVNVGNLVVVRVLSRTREIAVRKALGARQADIARLIATESALIGVVGGALGLVTAVGLLKLTIIAAPSQLARGDALAIVRLPLGIAGAVTAFAILLCGLLPLVVAAGEQSYAVLRADTRSGEGKAKRRARRWLVSTQIALALVLLTGAGLLVRTLTRLQSMDLGYRPEHLSVISFTGPESAFPNNERDFEVGKSLVRRIEALPNVIAVTPIESAPFQGQSFFIMQIAPSEQPVADRAHNPFTPFEFVGPDYFRAFQIPVVRGRGFSDADTKGAEKVVVVNETLARDLWRNENPSGRKVETLDRKVWTVVGVARDTHFRELKKIGPVAYFSWDQVDPFWSGSLALRTTSSLAAVLPSLRAASRDVNPSLVLYDAQTMDQLLDEPMAQPRLSAWLLSGFGVVALLLSAIGLYGVMSAIVRQQTRDIGVRVALGATSDDIRRLVLGDAMRIVAWGAGVGLVCALLSGRYLASQLFGVAPIDPISFASATLVLIVVATAAAYVPAHLASRTDPVTALRSE